MLKTVTVSAKLINKKGGAFIGKGNFACVVDYSDIQKNIQDKIQALTQPNNIVVKMLDQSNDSSESFKKETELFTFLEKNNLGSITIRNYGWLQDVSIADFKEDVKSSCDKQTKHGLVKYYWRNVILPCATRLIMTINLQQMISKIWKTYIPRFVI